MRAFANKAQFTEQEFELDLTGYTRICAPIRRWITSSVAAPRIRQMRPMFD